MSQAWLRGRPFLVALALLALVVLVLRLSGGTRVQAVHPVRRTVVESLAASGQVHGLQESRLAPQIQGILQALAVEEGDRVRKGQVLARLDRRFLEAQVEQADRAVRTAEARTAQASRGPLPSEVARVRAETSQAARTAEARLREAERRVEELETGATPEQVRQAEEAVLQAEASRRQADRDRERAERLWKESALARAALERARTEAEVARRAEEQARARLDEVRRGPRSEVVAQARAQRDAARAALTGAREAGSARLEELEAQPRPEDVAVARAGLEEARRALRVARERAAQAELRAPFDGLVLDRLAEPGDAVGPSQPVLSLVRWPQVEIRAAVDEVNLGRLEVGQVAVVTSDAFPEERLEARVSEIAPRVDPERGTVEFRVRPGTAPEWLRPGQTVSVNVVFQEGREELVIPLQAVTTTGRASRVLVVEGRVARVREVRVGLPGTALVPVHEGLAETDLVVVGPPGIEPGTRVRPEVRELAP